MRGAGLDPAKFFSYFLEGAAPRKREAVDVPPGSQVSGPAFGSPGVVAPLLE
jgi:hypothetical protein